MKKDKLSDLELQAVDIAHAMEALRSADKTHWNVDVQTAVDSVEESAKELAERYEALFNCMMKGKIWDGKKN